VRIEDPPALVEVVFESDAGGARVIGYSGPRDFDGTVPKSALTREQYVSYAAAKLEGRASDARRIVEESRIRGRAGRNGLRRQDRRRVAARHVALRAEGRRRTDEIIAREISKSGSAVRRQRKNAERLGFVDAQVVAYVLENGLAAAARLAPKRALALIYEDPRRGQWLGEGDQVVLDEALPGQTFKFADGEEMTTVGNEPVLRFAGPQEIPGRWVFDRDELLRLKTTGGGYSGNDPRSATEVRVRLGP